MTDTRIAAVVDGRHAHGDTVSVEGRAKGLQKHEHRGVTHGTFLLVSSETAVRVMLLPPEYAKYADQLADSNYNGVQRPPLVKVIGRVDRMEKVPTLVAEEIVRLEVPS